MFEMDLPLYTYPNENIYQNLDKISYEQTYQNQNFVLSLMHPHAPYRGLLLTFQLGNGKTYVAAGLTHLYNTYGFRVLFLAHNVSTINNFKNEYSRFIMDNQVNDEYTDITYMGITKFLSTKEMDIDNSLVIIDEAHNVRENATRYRKLQTILDNYDNIKILVITATPMIDKVDEMTSLRNLIEPNAPIAYSDALYSNVNVRFVGDDFGIGTYYKSVMKGLQLKQYKRCMANSHHDIYTTIRQLSLSVNNGYNSLLPLDEQSSKVAALLSSIVMGELTVAFSFFVKRGIHFIRNVLNDKGWREFGVEEEDERPCYAILDGKTSIDTINDIIDNFNSILNINGSIIQLLIGSSVMNESISLHNVKHVHVLTPFWNYGQVRQAVGRTIRMRSHEDLGEENPLVNIYLHVSVVEEDDEYSGIDLDMYNVSHDKDKNIKEQMKSIMDQSIWREEINLPMIPMPLPHVDNRLVLRTRNYVWDMRACFDTNINKISWYRIYRDRAICYDIKTGMRKMSNVDMYVIFPEPKEGEITIWKSIVDDRIRITDLRSVTTKKRRKRGKLICNMKSNEIDSISQYLNTPPNIELIFNKLREKGLYIENQVIINDL
jgi:superfamily II DNA or RNA helicase